MNSSRRRHNSIFIMVVGFVICSGRLLIKDTETSSVVVMSVVNIVALGFVLFLMISELNIISRKKIENAGVGTQQKKCGKIVSEVILIVALIIYGIFGILYVIKWKCCKGNDILSVMALTMSIASEGLVEYLKKPAYKVIIFFSKVRNY